MEKKILTKEQLSSIYSYLIESRVRYVDVVFETLDHIACDIEMQMNSDVISFEEAFDVSKKKWRTSLKPSNSFWIGVINTRPKIEIETCVRVYKDIFKKMFLLLILIPVFLLKINNFEMPFSGKWLCYFSNFLIMSGLGIIAYIFIKMILTKLKTSFSFIFYTQIFPIILIIGSMYLPYYDFYKVFEKIDIILILAELLNIVYVLMAIKLYKQHKQALKRYTSI
jgi:hypothetical protein